MVGGRGGGGEEGGGEGEGEKGLEKGDDEIKEKGRGRGGGGRGEEKVEGEKGLEKGDDEIKDKGRGGGGGGGEEGEGKGKERRRKERLSPFFGISEKVVSVSSVERWCTLLEMLVMKDLISSCVGQLFWQGASAHLRHLAASLRAARSLRVVCLMSSKLCSLLVQV